MIPSAAVGAILASCIAAVVSLLGLIISKEQKTSEFRQAWIDALRQDLSTYLTQVNAIRDAASLKYTSSEKRSSALLPLYSALNNSNFNICLRVNRSEEKSKLILASMLKFQQLFANPDSISPNTIRPIEQEFLKASQALLKFEWSRVKNGEATFQVAKLASAGVLLSAFAWGLWTIIWGGGLAAEGQAKPEVATPVSVIISTHSNNIPAVSSITKENANSVVVRPGR